MNGPLVFYFVRSNFCNWKENGLGSSDVYITECGYTLAAAYVKCLRQPVFSATGSQYFS